MHAVARCIADWRRRIMKDVGEQVEPGDLDVDWSSVDEQRLTQEVDHFFTRVGKIKGLAHGHLNERPDGKG